MDFLRKLISKAVIRGGIDTGSDLITSATGIPIPQALRDSAKDALEMLAERWEVPDKFKDLRKAAASAVDDVASLGGETAQRALEQLRDEGNPTALKAMLKRLADEDVKAGTPAHIKRAAMRHRELGAIAFMNSTQEALVAYIQAVKLDPNNVIGWTNLGLVQTRLGQADAAISSFARVLRLTEMAGVKSGIASAHNLLGAGYEAAGKPQQAMEQFQNALQIYKELGQADGAVDVLGNMGNVFKAIGALDDAQQIFTDVLDEEKKRKNPKGMAHAHGSLGVVYAMRGNFKDAQESFGEGLKIYMVLDDREGMATVCTNIGLAYNEEAKVTHDKKAKALACDFWWQARLLFDDIAVHAKVSWLDGLLRAAGCTTPRTPVIKKRTITRS